MTPPTVARKRLREWIALDPNNRTATAIARLLDVRQPSVSGWISGTSRPDTHLRLALQSLTDGYVSAVDWMSPKERRLAECTPPMRVLDTGTGEG